MQCSRQTQGRCRVTALSRRVSWSGTGLTSAAQLVTVGLCSTMHTCVASALSCVVAVPSGSSIKAQHNQQWSSATHTQRTGLACTQCCSMQASLPHKAPGSCPTAQSAKGGNTFNVWDTTWLHDGAAGGPVEGGKFFADWDIVGLGRLPGLGVVAARQLRGARTGV